MKQCNRCKIVKDESEFSKSSKYRDGLQWQCKVCFNAWKHEYDRQPKNRYAHHKREAAKRGIAFNISFDEWFAINSQPCHYCNNQLGSPVETVGGLDRIDNNGIYEVGNVVSSCFVCNSLKHDWTYDRAMELIKLHISAKVNGGHVCPKCLSVKNLEEFGKDKNGIAQACKECVRAYAKIQYYKHYPLKSGKRKPRKQQGEQK